MATKPQTYTQDDDADTFTSFEDILNVDPNDVERPRPLPQGSYEGVVISHRFDRSPKTLTPFIEYTIRPVAPMDDINMDELNEMGGIGNRTIRLTFWLTPDSKFRLKEFLENCDIKYEKTLYKMAEQAINCRIGIVVVHNPSKDNTQVYANISKTFSL